VNVSERLTKAGVRFECDSTARAVQRLRGADLAASEELKASFSYCP